jgi:pimeloyl-ACP methyl ester carboxylesterase
VSNHRDAQSLFEKVHAQHPNVVVIGRSLGTGVAVRLASEQPVSRLVLITPYDSLAEIAAAQFPYFPINWLLRDKYNSGQYAPTVTVPTRIIAAEHDEVIPRSSTEKLFERFPKGVASMKVIPATDHNTISNTREFLLELQAAL